MTADELADLIDTARELLAAPYSAELWGSGDTGRRLALRVIRDLLAVVDFPAQAADEWTIARLADPATGRYKRLPPATWPYPPMDWRPAAPGQTDTVSVCPPPAFDGSTWAGEPRRAGRANERIPNSGDGSP